MVQSAVPEVPSEYELVPPSAYAFDASGEALGSRATSAFPPKRYRDPSGAEARPMPDRPLKPTQNVAAAEMSLYSALHTLWYRDWIRRVQVN